MRLAAEVQILSADRRRVRKALPNQRQCRYLAKQVLRAIRVVEDVERPRHGQKPGRAGEVA